VEILIRSCNPHESGNGGHPGNGRNRPSHLPAGRLPGSRAARGMTTEGGLDVAGHFDKVRSACETLARKASGSPCSLMRAQATGRRQSLWRAGGGNPHRPFCRCRHHRRQTARTKPHCGCHRLRHPAWLAGQCRPRLNYQNVHEIASIPACAN